MRLIRYCRKTVFRSKCKLTDLDKAKNIEHYSMFDPPEADSMLDVHLYFSCNN
jgi:hypothetical protein